MKNKLTIMDIKGAIWDKRFQKLFPEYDAQFTQFMKDPGCGCNVAFLKSLMKWPDRLRQYFPNKDIPEKAPEEPETPNDWVVINCPIEQLEARMRKYPKGKRVVAAARWKDRLTVILNDVTAIMQVGEREVKTAVREAGEANMNWKIINTNKDDLINELRKLENNRKILTLTRWQDQITLIVNDLTALF